MEKVKSHQNSIVALLYITILVVLLPFCSKSPSVSGPDKTDPVTDPSVKDINTNDPTVIQDANSTKGPGRFGIARLEGGMKKQLAKAGNLSGDTLTFSLGELKATANYYFLLTNAGGSDITDIQITSGNASFVVRPQSINTLCPGISASLLPILSITAVHGIASAGVGKTQLMQPGKNSTGVTITGKTKINDSTVTDIKLIVTVSVEAKIMDLDLSDTQGIIDLSKPKGMMLGNHPFMTQYDGSLRGYTIWNKPGKFTNKGNVPINIRMAAFSNPDSVDTILSTTVQAGQNMEINSDIFPRGTALVVELDGSNTIAQPEKFFQANNGKCYLVLEVYYPLSELKCPPEKPFRCPDGACVDNENLCKQNDKCPPEKPFRCPDGTCADNENMCKQNDKCPPEKPFRCPDGTCTDNENMCKQNDKCPPEKPFRCPDGTCAENENMCKQNDKCPPEKPFRCPDGTCAENVNMCKK